MSKIAASILAANSLHMSAEIQKVIGAGCDGIHFDVMDGVFVPNISFGPGLLRDIRREFSVYADVHLMIIDPLPYIGIFAESGADAITVHIEASSYVEAIREIRRRGLRAGGSLKPATPAEALFDAKELPDQVLVMTVEPGFGGQELKPEIVKKIADLRRLGFRGLIEIDRGVSRYNAKLLKDAGADILVLGTKFFHADDPAELVRFIHSL